MITIVPTEYVHLEWNKVAPLIQKAIDITPGRIAASDIYIMLLAGEILLWEITDKDNKVIAALTSKVFDLPRGRICCAEWCGGSDMEDWIDELIVKIESYAKDMGCTIIEAHGRQGWKKKLEPHGWRQFQVSYEKHLKEQ